MNKKIPTQLEQPVTNIDHLAEADDWSGMARKIRIRDGSTTKPKASKPAKRKAKGFESNIRFAGEKPKSPKPTKPTPLTGLAGMYRFANNRSDDSDDVRRHKREMATLRAKKRSLELAVKRKKEQLAVSINSAGFYCGAGRPGSRRLRKGPRST